MKTKVRTQFELPFAPLSPRPVTGGSALLDGQTVEYVLHRGQGRRRISLSIDERGLRIGAPQRASMREIEHVLHAHANWILSKLAEWRKKSVPAPRWQSGDTVMYLGRPLRLDIAAGAEHVVRAADVLHLAVPNTEPTNIAALVKNWLRDQCNSEFTARVARYRESVGVMPGAVRLSDARTRWGSCHASGRILLNWRLIQMPERLIDYVIVHELAHLKEMNHSPRFWAVVGRVIPDYAGRRREIRHNAHRYILA